MWEARRSCYKQKKEKIGDVYRRFRQIMVKKIYSAPQILILEIDVEDTMVNKTSMLHDQN